MLQRRAALTGSAVLVAPAHTDHRDDRSTHTAARAGRRLSESEPTAARHRDPRIDPSPPCPASAAMSVVSGPEPAGETRVRRWVLLAFLLCYAACAPLWYATSRVNRESMPAIPEPHSEHEAQVTHVLPLQLHCMFAREVAAAEWKAWATSASQLLRQELAAKRAGSNDAGHRVQWVIEAPRDSGMAALTTAARNVSLDALRSMPADLDDALAQLPARSSAPAAVVSSVSLPLWRLFVLVSEHETDEGVWTMGRHRHAFISVAERRTPEQRRSIIEQAANMLHWIAEGQACPVLPGAPSSASASATATPSSSPACSGSRSLSQRLSFTLLNDMGDELASEGVDYSWNFAQMQRGYLQTLLDRVGKFVHLQVDSSVRHYAALTHEMKPIKINIKGTGKPATQTAGAVSSTEVVASAANQTVWSLRSSALRNLIGSIGEWNAPSPLVSHSMELLAYIPPPEHRPLVINFSPRGSAATRHTALFVSQYGGVAVVNAPGECASTEGSCLIDTKAVQHIMQVFVEQIRHALAMGTRTDQTGVSDWELDLFASRVIRVNLADSLGMLQGLYALLASVPHMPVDLDVQAIVQATIRSRQEAHRLLREGQWEQAGLASQEAVRTASQAFFHPNMLPSLYFPDEHLYAVYLPFFLPITVPLVVALIKIIGDRKKSKTA